MSAAALLVPMQIRDSIKSLFPDRDCYTLVRPMHDERALNHLDALDTSQLRPEFSQVSMRLLLALFVEGEGDAGGRHHY
jgi:hypothetical protein